MNARSYPAFQNSLDRDNDTRIRIKIRRGLINTACVESAKAVSKP
jgi:hypothetical protein